MGNNVLADVGSRLPWGFALVKHLPVPDRPIREVIRLFFSHSQELEQAITELVKEMDMEPFVPLPSPVPPRVPVVPGAN